MGKTKIGKDLGNVNHEEVYSTVEWRRIFTGEEFACGTGK